MDIETENVINLIFPEGIPGKINFITLKLIVNVLLLNNASFIYMQLISESWKENPNFYQYLSKLGGFDVDQLSKNTFINYPLKFFHYTLMRHRFISCQKFSDKEPDHLSDEKNAVLQTTQKLVFANYKTFIQTAESSREILNHVISENISLKACVYIYKSIKRFIIQLYCFTFSLMRPKIVLINLYKKFQNL